MNTVHQKAKQSDGADKLSAAAINEVNRRGSNSHNGNTWG
jgi:hypothetical protein